MSTNHIQNVFHYCFLDDCDGFKIIQSWRKLYFLFISLQESNEVCLSHQAICDQLSGTFIVSFKLPGPLGNFTNG